MRAPTPHAAPAHAMPINAYAHAHTHAHAGGTMTNTMGTHRAPRGRSVKQPSNRPSNGHPNGHPNASSNAPSRVRRTLRGAAAAMMLGASLGVVGMAVPGTASAQAVAVGQGEALQTIELGLNKSLVIDLPADAFDILVANPEVADAITRSSRRIYLFGRAVGETNIFVFGENGEPIANLDIRVERDVGTLEGDLERFIPGSDIDVEIVNDNVILTGAVLTPQDAQRAVQLAEAFVTGGEATTGQFNEVAQSEGDVAIGGEARRSSQIVNLLTIMGENQVTLKLTVAEIQRSVLKQLGVRFNGSVSAQALNGSNFGLDPITGSNRGLTSMGLAGGQSSNFSFGGRIGSNELGVGFQATVNAMNQAGVMRTLAEPSLTAVSGQEASFRVGGTYNVLGGVDVNDDTGGLILESKEIPYGVAMSFKPVVLSSGRISIALSTSVSEPTGAGSQPGANATVLSLRTREAKTTVEMPSGGSFMIAGLIRDEVRQTIAKTPGLSNMPILGSLFRSRSFTRDETELVIIATPYLVRPVARNELARPDDNFHAENDTKAHLLGRVNKIYGNRNKPAGPYHGNVGFIYK